MSYNVLQIHALSFCYNFKHTFVLFVTEGELEVLKNNKVLGKMEGGKAFGELAILYNCTRTASVRGTAKLFMFSVTKCQCGYPVKLCKYDISPGSWSQLTKYRSNLSVKNGFCMITPLPFDIQWWYFTQVLPMTGGRPPIDFWVKRSKVMVKFKLSSLHRFHTITPLPFGIHWWYFTRELIMTQGEPLLILGLIGQR